MIALLAVACGGNADLADGVASLTNTSTLDSPVESESAALTEEESLFAFAACLREQGLDVDDPTVDADGNLQPPRPTPPADGSAPEFDRAAIGEACGHFLNGVNLGFRNEDRTEVEDQLLEFASCMRDNGYDLPDPDFSSVGPGQRGPFGQLDRDDPAFQAAQTACAEIIDGFGRGLGGPRGGQGDG